MFNQYPSIILSGDLLENLASQRCIRLLDGVGGFLENCAGLNELCLEALIVEVVTFWINHKVR